MKEQNKFEELTESVKTYANTTYELAILKATEKASNIGADTISVLLIVKLLSLAVLILSISVCFYIGSIMDETYWGFLIVGGAYLVIALLLLSFRNSLLKKPFLNIIIKALLKQHE